MSENIRYKVQLLSLGKPWDVAFMTKMAHILAELRQNGVFVIQRPGFIVYPGCPPSCNLFTAYVGRCGSGFQEEPVKILKDTLELVKPIPHAILHFQEAIKIGGKHTFIFKLPIHKKHLLSDHKNLWILGAHQAHTA